MRCALVGLGRIGSLLEDDALREKPATHAGAIAGNPDCELVAGCDTDAERRERFRERWGCDPLYAEAGEMLHQETKVGRGIDALFVATHPESHLHMCRLAAAYRVPIVVCEKPLADTLRRARGIKKLHRPPDLTILTNHERRYSKDYLNARKTIRSGRLGRLLGVHGTLYFGSKMSHREVLLHDGTHMVDIINFLGAGRLTVRSVIGRMGRRRGSSYLYGVLERMPGRDANASGPDARSGEPVPVVIEVGSDRDHLVFEVTLSCSEGRLRVGNGVYAVEESRESPYYEGYRSLIPLASESSGPTGYFANMVADAVACFREPGREPVSSALHGYEVMEFICSWRRIFKRT